MTTNPLAYLWYARYQELVHSLPKAGTDCTNPWYYEYHGLVAAVPYFSIGG